jgi:transglutaminase-like putative cysteine protease
MTPGSIQSLFMDDSPAFRVEFEAGTPGPSERYWRGPVFWNFDGQTWKSGFFGRNVLAEAKPESATAPLRYEIQMEPTEQRWLFTLDYPALVPRGTRLTIDYQLITRRPITQLRSFVLASDPDFIDSPELKKTMRWVALELPDGFNPRTAEMMAAWRQEAGSDTDIIRRTLDYFNQQEFHYTLNPPLLSEHTVDEFLFVTQRGFCEHYASAFTIMMRMAGIPARVVTGYQGGYFNDFGSYMLVRQSDAHAWSEVWVKGSGWTRIDPTAAIAPRNTFDLIQRTWNNWVVAFGAESQSRLFTVFGWGIFDTAKLVIAMVAAILVLAAFIFLLAPMLLKFRSSRKQDPLLQLWQGFIKKLVKAGVVYHPSMGPMELATVATGQMSNTDDGIRRIAGLYTLCRYSRDAGDQAELAELIARFQPRPAS